VTRTVTGKRSPLIAKALTPGKSYRCVVTASNSRGAGLPSSPSAKAVA